MDEQRKAALKSLVETQELAAKQEERQGEILAQSNERLSEQAQQLEFEISQIESADSVTRRASAGKEEALRLEIELTAAREKAIAFRKIDLDLQKQMVDATPETVDALYRIADAEKARLGLLIDEKVSREKTRDAASTAAEEWKTSQQDMWRSIDDTARETFRSILDSGKGTFERLRDALKNGLHDLLYELTIKKWIIQISTEVSGSGGLGSRGSGGGAMGGIGKWFEGLFSGGSAANTTTSSAFVEAIGMQGFAAGGVMTGRGPMPLRTYAGGGVANSPQVAVFGEGSTPEAYVPLPDGRRIPVAMSGGGGPVFNIDARGASVEAVRDLRRLVMALNGSVEPRAIAAVAGASRRGLRT
jgi:hypothetical protein